MTSVPVWLAYASTGATVLAALMAAFSIRQSTKQAKASQDALLVERRVDFELEVLSDLAEYNEKSSNVAGRNARMRTLARLLPTDLVPLTRAAFGLPSTEVANSRVAEERPRAQENRQAVADHMRAELADEILSAIASKLQERGRPRKYHGSISSPSRGST